MASHTEDRISFIEDFEQHAASAENQGLPKWLISKKEENLSRFQQLGIPTTKDEEWKYTNISPIFSSKYSLSASTNIKEPAGLKDYLSNDAISLVFVNGVFSRELSTTNKIPKNLVCLTLKDALKTCEKDVQKALDQFNANDETAFIALNQALSQEGVFIKIPEKTVISEVIQIIHIVDDIKSPILIQPRTIISVGRSAEATVLEDHISFSDKLIYFSNALTDIYLNENSTLHYCKAQKESLKAFHIGSTRVWQERSSNFYGFSIMNGAAITRNNLDIILNGEGATSLLNGLYCLNGDQTADNHTFVHHRQPNCISNQLYKGILNGSSHGVFNGKIYVHPIAQKTNSYQLNKTLLLGSEARIDTKPQLEIFADDVKCTHGATIGQLNENELFYFQSRAVSRREAVRMLSKGFVEDLLSTIKNDIVQEKLHILLQPTFASF